MLKIKMDFSQNSMENSRFEKHHVLFLLGMISLILACIHIGFGFYCFPFVVFKLSYYMPIYFFSTSQFLQTFYGLLPKQAELLIVALLIFLGLLFFLLADIISNYIDNSDMGNLYQKRESIEENLPSWVEPKHGLRNFLMVILILLFTVTSVKIFEWTLTDKQGLIRKK